MADASLQESVAQVVNRLDGYAFDEQDDQLFEAFAIFCGLGINNALLYAQVSIAAAKQQVALEVTNCIEVCYETITATE